MKTPAKPEKDERKENRSVSTTSFLDNRPLSQLYTAIRHSNKSSVSQMKFTSDGAWMDDVGNSTLNSKFSVTTRALWAALRDLKDNVAVKKGGSGGSYNWGTKTISLSSNYLKSIEEYVDDGSKDKHLGRATASLTHEMSHAHDVLAKGESPEFADRMTLDYVTAVLKTELKAWMKEARSARENKKDKSIPLDGDSSQLVCSWLAIHYVGDGCLTLDIYENSVIGRLTKYYNDNKPDAYKKSLVDYVKKKPEIMVLLKQYAATIRGKFTSDDKTLKSISQVKKAMK